MAQWSIDDIAWDRFDPAKVDPKIVPIVKAASLVERNAEEYGKYLASVFRDDPEFVALAWQWVAEEIQHGVALGRWACMVDPSFDFDGAFERFKAEIRLPTEATASIRGSRVGEFVARCMVETGTSTMYTALAQATDEPVLKEIAQRIAADELRHYKLFYTYSKRYMEQEEVGFWRRLYTACRRAAETEDDELAYAFYAANQPSNTPYDHGRCKRLYAYGAYPLYRYAHLERAVAMAFKAVGLKPHGWLNRFVARIAFGFTRWRVARIGAKEALLVTQTA